MKTRRNILFTVGAIGVIVGLMASEAVPVAALTDSTVAEERAMLQTRVGQQFTLTTPVGKVKAKIRSVRFSDSHGWPNDSGRLRVSVVVKNFSTSPNGIQVFLRCGTSNDQGGWYSDSTLDPQQLPPRTQESGVLYVGMPKETVDKGRHCINPRLIVKPLNAYQFSAGRRDFAARIKLPEALGDLLH